MKAIVDTCVVIDFLQRREPFSASALTVFQAAASEQFSGCITAKSATDIYYLTHRCTHSDAKTRDILNSLLSVVSMLDSVAVDIQHREWMNGRKLLLVLSWFPGWSGTPS